MAARLVAALLLAASVPLVAQAPTLRYAVPTGWQVEQPRSSMRLAQFTLPAAAGDAEPARAVIYFFGQGQGGSVSANLERWAAQMAQAGGRPGTLADGTTAMMTANGLKVTVLDIAGTYAGDMGAQGPPAAHAGYRLKAAVIETTGGPYFVKVTGPARTVARWDESIGEFLKGVSYK